MSRARLTGLLALVPAVLVLASCDSQPAAEENVARSVVERGPVTMTVSVEPRLAQVGDSVRVEVVVQTPEDFVVQLPSAASLGELAVRAMDSPEPRLAPAGGQVWRRTFTVDALGAGPLQVPPLEVQFARRPQDPQADVLFDQSLRSDDLQVEVRSALTDEDNVMQPRDITGTVLPEHTWGELARAGVWPVVATLAVVALVVGVLVAWRRRRMRPAPPILPEVWALRALDELAAEDWFGTGRAREFYYQLTEIVRVYIERKFALAAPEMTTPEFLAALARERTTLPYDTERLRVFLEACDLVKYAALRPRREDADAALETARAFVQTTAASELASRAAVAGGQAA
jgi:hypothetical protein